MADTANNSLTEVIDKLNAVNVNEAKDVNITAKSVAGATRPIQTAAQPPPLPQLAPAVPTKTNLDLSTFFGKTKENLMLALSFLRLKLKMLGLIRKSLPTKLNISKEVSVSNVMGQPESVKKVTSIPYTAIQLKLLSRISKVLPKKFNFDRSVSIGNLLSQKKENGLISGLRFEKLQFRLLSRIEKALPKRFSFQKQITLGDIFGETPKLGLFSRLQLFKLRSYVLSEIQKAVKNSLRTTTGGSNDRSAAGKGIATIGEGLGKGIKGLGSGVGKGIELVLTGLAKGLKQLSNPRLLIGTAVIAAVGGALWVSAKAFKEFGSNIDWKNVFIGIGALALVAVGLKLLGKAAGQILIGSLALLAISGAFYVAAKAFQQFADISWKDVFIGIGALTLVGVVAAAAGAFAPLILLGSLALAALGVALIPVAYAFKLFGEAAIPFAKAFGIVGEAIGKIIGVIGDTFVKILDSITNTIERLSAIGSEGLIGTAAGIGALGIALATFGAGSFIGSLLSFFSKDPVKDFERFGKIAPNLEIAGNAIEKLTKSLNTFDFGLLKKLGSNLLDLGQTLAKDTILSSFTQLSGIADIFKTVSDSATTFTNALKSMIDLVSTDDGGIDLLIEKLYQLGDALNTVSNLSNIGTTIVPQLQSAALTPTSAINITPLKTNTSGEALHYETMLTQSAKEDAANSAASVMIGGSTNSVKTQNTVNNSSVTYNTTDAFDNTQLRVLRNYMF